MIFLHNNIQLFSDEIAIIIGFLFLCYLSFITLSFLEKSYSSKAYKIITSILGVIVLVPLVFIFLISDANIIAFAAFVLFIGAAIVHIKKLKTKKQN